MGEGHSAVLVFVNMSVRCIHTWSCLGVCEEAIDNVDEFMYK